MVIRAGYQAPLGSKAERITKCSMLLLMGYGSCKAIYLFIDGLNLEDLLKS